MARFETMVEPFNVRVEKLKGTTKYEIPLPEQDGSAPGTGWSKDQVRELQTWIVKEWAGGGHYFFAIVDAQAQSMEWNAYYSPSEFPERVPPTLAAAYATGVIPFAGQSTPVNQKVQMASFPTSGSNLPPSSAYPGGAQMMPSAIPMPSPTPFAPQPFYPQPYGYGYQPPQAAGSNSEVQALREQLAQERQAAQQRDFERQVAAMKAESERRMAEMHANFSSMIEKLGQQLTGPRAGAVDPVLAQVQEQNRALQEQLRRQEEERERARREQELREQVTRSAEDTRRMIDEANRRTETMMREMASAKPDQQLVMFQTMFSAQVETMKEIARNSQMQIERMQANTLRPQDILAIAKDASSSTDQVAANITRQFEAMFGIQRQLIEQAAQLNQGGGNEVIGLVRDGASKLAEMAEKYTGDKAKENIAQINAQAKVAQAQADVVKAQQERLSQMAAMEAAVRAGQAVQMPDGSFRAAGGPQQPALGAPPTNGHGPTTVVPPSPAWVPPHMRKPAAPSAGLSGAPAAPAPDNVVPFKPDGSPNGPRRIKGRTDLEWFGPILPNVNELRVEVAKFIAGLEQKPPIEDGASPADAATAINIAAGQVLERGIPIPAMIDLLIQGMLADFIDVLLPDAPQAYRDDVVKLLAADEDDGEVDDDGANEDGDEDAEQPQAGA
jgi:hypothetical protein